MNTLYVILALLALPLVLGTLFQKTESGIRLELGSFFLIRDLPSRIFRVRTIRDWALLALRMACALMIALAVLEPRHTTLPEREVVAYQPAAAAAAAGAQGSSPVILLSRPGVVDTFNEDRFFLESLAKHVTAKAGKLAILYNPDRGMVAQAAGDLVIFPSPAQERGAFDAWSDWFYFTGIQEGPARISGGGIVLRNYYRAVLVNRELVTVHASLENGAPVLFSFEEGKRRVLVFSFGPGSFWGDAGASGALIDWINGFQLGGLPAQEKAAAAQTVLVKTGRVDRLVSSALFVYAALAFLLLESAWHVGRGYLRRRKRGTALPVLLLALALLAPAAATAEDFRFIELDADGAPADAGRMLFGAIRSEVERVSSVRIDPVYYEQMGVSRLLSGELPRVPYLWIVGCKGAGFYSPALVRALGRFIERGGIVVLLTCGSAVDIEYLHEIERLARALAPGAAPDTALAALPARHPLYRSFFLLGGGGFFGLDISASTRRTALIVARDLAAPQVLAGDVVTLRRAVNVVLYLLSGNYKSDQVHTRSILNRLKKRELYK